jgi:hypothetical protein
MWKIGVCLVFAGLTGSAAMVAADGPARPSGFEPLPAPDVAGVWAGEGWGRVELRRTKPVVYDGTYAETWGDGTGKVHVEGSSSQQRFLGAWRQGDDRFGDISIRLVRDGSASAIRGAYTTDPACKIEPANPKLADLECSNGGGRGEDSADPPSQTPQPTPAARRGETGHHCSRLAGRGSKGSSSC